MDFFFFSNVTVWPCIFLSDSCEHDLPDKFGLAELVTFKFGILKKKMSYAIIGVGERRGWSMRKCFHK